ncbi:ABC transporter substrate-binding protein [Desulfobacula phenolica]|uniref:Iron complex transport system substrate-binding protein n=1 Tax=Desulfobacula phenolica TaxID=90732 RepID=A0A1H2FIP5_9BACT|nr:ABC transporter substrate-binding protein [Desulfobacula phenolica]SDU07227.1 iron complex transport system substrate-binding protein [Desulfobacula phenolica]
MTKKRIFLLLFSACFVFLFYRIYHHPETRARENYDRTRIVTDMKGRAFQVADPIRRIALLGGPTGQVAFILGVQDHLCAVTNTLKMSKLVQEMYPAIKALPGPRTTSGNINIEELINSNPDIAIAGDIDGQIVLDKTRIPVAFLEDGMGEGIEDIKREIRFYGTIFQAPDRAEKYVAFLERVMHLIEQRTRDIPVQKRKNVFQGFSPSHLVTLGGDTFMQERIKLSGCENAAETVTTIGKRTGLHSGLAEVSMEQVLEWDPDILVINYGKPADLYKDPQWRNIRAVRNKQIYSQPAGVFIFNRPTAESAVIFPLWLAAIAYPDLFEDISINGIVKTFYREIFDFDLTDLQVHDILLGTYEFKMMKGIKNRG